MAWYAQVKFDWRRGKRKRGDPAGLAKLLGGDDMTEAEARRAFLAWEQTDWRADLPPRAVRCIETYGLVRRYATQ